MINTLRNKNKELIKKYEKEGDVKNTISQKVIFNLLSHDDCFFKISLEQAYTILKELNVKPEMYEQIYLQLTKPKN
ncbi:MAG: hypothetical protein E7376_03575 [Clostridiales bacterium]|nr:hypothetical protein [Clostridiales bacterium]